MSDTPKPADDDAIAEAMADRFIADLEHADPAVIRRVMTALRNSDEEQPLNLRIDAGITLTHALGLDDDTARMASRCGCSRAAIHKRREEALAKFRAAAKRSGLLSQFDRTQP